MDITRLTTKIPSIKPTAIPKIRFNLSNKPIFSVSLVKNFRKIAMAILKHGYMHCIGTDAHDMAQRAPDWSVQEFFYKAGYTEEWKRAQEIMQKVIAGEQVCVDIGKPIKKFMGIYL